MSWWGRGRCAESPRRRRLAAMAAVEVSHGLALWTRARQTPSHHHHHHFCRHTVTVVVVATIIVVSADHRRHHDGSTANGRTASGTPGASHNRDDRGRRAERDVRRSRGPGGRRSDHRQRAGDCGLSQGTATPPAHQLLHRVAGGRRPVGRSGGHTVRSDVQRRAASSPAPVHVLHVATDRPVHRVHTQSGGRVRRPVLGHTLSDGLLHELQHQNRNQ